MHQYHSEGVIMSLKGNREQLVITVEQGNIAPAHQWVRFEVGSAGEVFSWPSTGGTTYNVKIGDSMFDWAGEHIESGVSTTMSHNNRKAEACCQFLSCCGNEAMLISGAAKGEKGTVLGHHGGVNHLMLDFPDDTLDKLTCDDKFLIQRIGRFVPGFR